MTSSSRHNTHVCHLVVSLLLIVKIDDVTDTGSSELVIDVITLRHAGVYVCRGVQERDGYTDEKAIEVIVQCDVIMSRCPLNEFTYLQTPQEIVALKDLIKLLKEAIPK